MKIKPFSISMSRIGLILTIPVSFSLYLLTHYKDYTDLECLFVAFYSIIIFAMEVAYVFLLLLSLKIEGKTYLTWDGERYFNLTNKPKP